MSKVAVVYMRLIFHADNAQLCVLFVQDFRDVAIQTVQDGSGVIGCHRITVAEIRCADNWFSVIYHRIENGCGDIPVTHQKLERKIFLCRDRVIHEVSSSLYLLPPNGIIHAERRNFFGIFKTEFSFYNIRKEVSGE